MPKLTPEQLRQHQQMITSMENDRSVWLSLWRELSDNYLPQRYKWLMSSTSYYANRARRQYIINNTGTQAARTLAAGMLNGITSPSRPWLKLHVSGYDLDAHRDLAIWCEAVERVLFKIFAESNFYNAMAVLYLDMVVFGTGVCLIYEDIESVIRCYNPPLGEYYLQQSHRMQVNVFARTFTLKISQYVQRWTDPRYWSDRVKNAVEQAKNGSASLMNQDVEINHVIGPNLDNLVPRRFSYYEVYWEAKREQSQTSDVLELRGFHELPGMFARWELSGGDSYGVSPGMDSLGDNIELQHIHRNKAELLEKSHKPPVMWDVTLQNSPLGMMPGGSTFVPGLSSTTIGGKPIFTVDPRFDQINIDQISTENRIKDTFFNYLFKKVMDLQTVRSAAEINSIDTEKLILLGGVLERFESEGLDPGVKRAFSIADRAGLLPPLPRQYQNVEIEIQYVSILSVAQRAAGTAPTERFLALVGNLAAVVPQALDIPDFDQLIINYARDIGVRASEIRDLATVAQERQAKNAASAASQALAAGDSLSSSAKNLAATPVGGGASALDRILASGGSSFRPLG